MEEIYPTFKKIARLHKPIIITEKIDGTNGLIHINAYLEVFAGSRNRWLQYSKEDNFGFAHWVHENKEELRKLGQGYHYGEWWGQGIGRRYGMDKKVFSLFNTHRWGENGVDVRPECCDVIPILATFDTFCQTTIEMAFLSLKRSGSIAASKYGVNFKNPEGVVVYHSGANLCLKVSYEDTHKGNVVKN